MAEAGQALDGVLLLNKPPGITSHDAVQIVRKTISQKRVGHTGTLDPAAEGLLLICIGKATKIAQFMTGMDKTYKADICLGYETTTYDREGEFLNSEPNEIPDLSDTEIEVILKSFSGKIIQKVPAYSAVRVNGKRLHELARKNIEVETPEREIEIKEIIKISYEKPILTIRVSCSKGTYIRTLAYDIGKAIGCGAYMKHLVREQVGNHSLSDALSIESMKESYNDGSLTNHLLRYDQVLSFSSMIVKDDFTPSVFNGVDINSEFIAEVEGRFTSGDHIFLKNGDRTPLAIGTANKDSEHIFQENSAEDKIFNYVRVLN